MVCLDHGFEFVDLFAALSGAGVGVVGREESDGVVAPIVAEAFFLQEAVVDELVDRHEFDRGDAEFLQVFDHRRVCESCVGSADFRRHFPVEVGHAAHMGLVDDRIVIGDVWVLVVAPIEIRIDHRRLHGVRRRIQGVHGRDVIRAFEPVGVETFIAVDVAFDGFGIWVQKQFVRIAPQSLVRIVGTVYAVAVALSRLDAGQVVVPDVRILLGHFDSGLMIVFIEQTELHFLRNLRKKGEIHTGAIVARTEWIHRSRSDLHSISISRPLARNRHYYVRQLDLMGVTAPTSRSVRRSPGCPTPSACGGSARAAPR